MVARVHLKTHVLPQGQYTSSAKDADASWRMRLSRSVCCKRGGAPAEKQEFAIGFCNELLFFGLTSALLPPGLVPVAPTCCYAS
jgi:hypothetical protein